MSALQKIIRNNADVAEGAAWLAASDPRFADALAQTGPLPLRLKPDGFAGLVEIIIGQQVSVASANAIKARMVAAGFTSEQPVLTAGEGALQGAGLSRAKARYVTVLAQAGLDYDALRTLDEETVMAQLTAVKGIGPWTAQVYVMFCLGRADVFPGGDLALQIAAQSLLGLPERPKPEALAQIAQDWSPWRSVAARTLFAYYRILKNREGLG